MILNIELQILKFLNDLNYFMANIHPRLHVKVYVDKSRIRTYVLEISTAYLHIVLSRYLSQIMVCACVELIVYPMMRFCPSLR